MAGKTSKPVKSKTKTKTAAKKPARNSAKKTVRTVKKKTVIDDRAVRQSKNVEVKRPDLAVRCASGLVIIGLTLGLVFAGPWPMTAYIMLLAGVSAFEWTRMLVPVPRAGIYGFAAGLAAVTVFSVAAINMAAFTPICVLFAAILLRAFMAFRGFHENEGKVAGGFFYIVLSLSYLTMLVMYQGSEKLTMLNQMAFVPFDLAALKCVIVFLFVTVWASDSIAYVFGRLIGGPKLAPKISPKKTWAGLAGSITGGALALALGGYILETHYTMQAPSIMALILFGAFLGIAGQVGDLAISKFKRSHDLKDMGRLIPGHGGILDRIDALLLMIPFYYLAFTLWA